MAVTASCSALSSGGVFFRNSLNFLKTSALYQSCDCTMILAQHGRGFLPQQPELFKDLSFLSKL
jgi:hypothetical protein